MAHILIIDDDESLGRSLQLQLELNQLESTHCLTGVAGIEAVRNHTFCMVLLDLQLPDYDGLDILQILKKEQPNLPVVIVSARQDMEATINAIKFGAFDYIRKPLDMDEVLITLEKVKMNQEFKKTKSTRQVLNTWSSKELVGRTPAMQDVLKQIGLLSRNKVAILITGESGTGKELVARAIHKASCPDRPFVAINCAAVVPTLLESELFGHEKGAFTGAYQRKVGKLEEAKNGILFFDEMGEMPVDLQTKLLRILQEREFERVGGTETIPFQARVLFATHCNLPQMIEQKKFRLDLYYRIAIAQIHLPPLRDRKDDIALITQYLMERISQLQNIAVQRIEKEVFTKLRSHQWPGNVRELENVLTRAMALSQSMTCTADQIKFESSFWHTPQVKVFHVSPLVEIERAYIEKSLVFNSWNITLTAKQLQVSPTTLRKKIKDYDLRH